MWKGVVIVVGSLTFLIGAIVVATLLLNLGSIYASLF